MSHFLVVLAFTATPFAMGDSLLDGIADLFAETKQAIDLMILTEQPCSESARGARVLSNVDGCPRNGQSPDSKIPLFQSDDVLNLEIRGEFPVDALNDIAKPAILAYVASDGTHYKMDVEIQARGHDRRIRCKSLPPLKVILPKQSDGRAPLFAHAGRDLKIVSPCRVPPTQESEQAILGEYAIYKMLEAAGFVSFKVRLAQVDYVKSSGEKFARGYSIFIENHKDVARRYKINNIEGNRPPPTSEREIAEWLALDGDHVTRNVRNLVDDKGVTRAYVSYDFDKSYLLNGDNGVEFALRNEEAILRNFLTSGPDENRQKARVAMKRVVDRVVCIFRAITKVPLSESNKEVFRKRIWGFVSAANRALKTESELNK